MRVPLLQHFQKLAYSIPEAAKSSGLTVVIIEAAIRHGELKAHLIGIRTIILAEELARWITSAPPSQGEVA